MTLVAGSLGLWLALAYPTRLLWGDLALLQSAAAALICLVPAVLTFLWSQRSLSGPPEQQMAAILGGTTVRLLAVLGVAVTLFLMVPAFAGVGFFVWIVVFYLVTLALEVVLLLRRLPAADRSSTP